MVPHSWSLYFLTKICPNKNLTVWPDYQLFHFSAKLSRISSRCRLNIYLLMNIACRINRILRNTCAKRRDNGHKMLVMTYPCTVIAPRDLYNPFGSLTLMNTNYMFQNIELLNNQYFWAIRCLRFITFRKFETEQKTNNLFADAQMPILSEVGTMDAVTSLPCLEEYEVRRDNLNNRNNHETNVQNVPNHIMVGSPTSRNHNAGKSKKGMRLCRLAWAYWSSGVWSTHILLLDNYGFHVRLYNVVITTFPSNKSQQCPKGVPQMHQHCSKSIPNVSQHYPWTVCNKCPKLNLRPIITTQTIEWN